MSVYKHLLKDLLTNPITYWIRWLINKYYFLLKNNRVNVQFGYLSHVTNSIMNDNTTIYHNVRLHNCELGEYSYVANDTRLIGVKTGKFCSIGPSCRIGLGKHPVNEYISTHPIFFSPQSHVGVHLVGKSTFNEFEAIEIGSDVWIGVAVIILDGVKVGDGAIIAAGSVVTKDVLPFSIVGGVPAKLIKYRFCKSKVNEILASKWWEKPLSEIEDVHEVLKK